VFVQSLRWIFNLIFIQLKIYSFTYISICYFYVWFEFLVVLGFIYSLAVISGCFEFDYFRPLCLQVLNLVRFFIFLWKSVFGKFCKLIFEKRNLKGLQNPCLARSTNQTNYKFFYYDIKMWCKTIITNF